MKRIVQTLKQKWPEYLLEVIVIVLGVLGAFSLNNWNESRKDRKREVAILQQLKTEFRSNLNQLDERIEIRMKMLDSSVDLLEFIDQPSERNKDSVNARIAWTIPYTTFDPIVNDLASSGSLRIIRSDTLKQLLSFWTSEIIQVTEGETNWTKYRNEVYVPFLIKHYQLRTMRDQAMQTNLLRSFLIDQEDRRDTYRIREIGKTNHPDNVNKLLDHPDYEDHLVRLIISNRNTQHQAYILRDRMLEILGQLDQELQIHDVK